jgi:Ca2+/Na+ antiporter
VGSGRWQEAATPGAHGRMRPAQCLFLVSVSAAAAVAGIVAILKEVAELFGCMVGLSDLMTGVSLVALGTSM